MKYRLVGTPLAVDSLKKSGVIAVAKKLLEEGATLSEVVTAFEEAEASTNTGRFAFNETLKWKAYDQIKGGKLFDFFGVDLAL